VTQNLCEPYHRDCEIVDQSLVKDSGIFIANGVNLGDRIVIITPVTTHRRQMVFITVTATAKPQGPVRQLRRAPPNRSSSSNPCERQLTIAASRTIIR
jgi:hypothetical protein